CSAGGRNDRQGVVAIGVGAGARLDRGKIQLESVEVGIHLVFAAVGNVKKPVAVGIFADEVTQQADGSVIRVECGTARHDGTRIREAGIDDLRGSAAAVIKNDGGS